MLNIGILDFGLNVDKVCSIIRENAERFCRVSTGLAEVGLTQHRSNILMKPVRGDPAGG